MTTVFYILFILSCIVLIVSVLLQPGKADAGALFSSSISSTAFGPRGTQSILAKITIGAAAAFMLIAIALSLPSMTGQRSVFDTVGQEETTPTPQASPAASPVASPAAPGSNANTGATTNTTTPASPAPASSPGGGASPAPGK